jgi:hypothetical protein
MKKLTLGLLLFAVVGIASAQDTPIATPAVTAPCTITAPTREESARVFAITFQTLLQSLRVPNTADMMQENMSLTLNCASTPEQVAQIETSRSINLNELAPNPENPDGIAEEQTGYGIVNTSFANLRSGPAPEFARVAVVSGGDTLVVLGRNEDLTWWYVQVGEVRGWIFNDLIILRGDLRNVPLVSGQAELTPISVYVGWAGNSLWNGLQLSSEVICPLQGGLEFLVLGRSFNEEWLYVVGVCQDGSIAEGWMLAEAGLIRNPAGLIIPVLQG